MLKFPSICRFIVKNKVFFRSAGYSACLEYTKTIITSVLVTTKVMDIYRAANRRGKYPLLGTSDPFRWIIVQYFHASCLVQTTEFSQFAKSKKKLISALKSMSEWWNWIESDPQLGVTSKYIWTYMQAHKGFFAFQVVKYKKLWIYCLLLRLKIQKDHGSSLENIAKEYLKTKMIKKNPVKERQSFCNKWISNLVFRVNWFHSQLNV